MFYLNTVTFLTIITSCFLYAIFNSVQRLGHGKSMHSLYLHSTCCPNFFGNGALKKCTDPRLSVVFLTTNPTFVFFT